jgi:hypothetical protein
MLVQFRGRGARAEKGGKRRKEEERGGKRRKKEEKGNKVGMVSATRGLAGVIL